MAETACIAPYPSKSMTSSSKDFPAFGPNSAPLHSYTGNGGLTSYTFNGGVPSSKPSALGPSYSSNNGIAAVASIASTGSSAYNVIQGVNSGLHSNGNPLVQSGRGSEDLSVSSVDSPPFSSSKGAICSSNEQSNPADGKAVATVELTPSRRPSLWYEEEIDESLRWSFGLTSILFTGCSRFQEIALLDTEPFGKVLTLDRKMQSAEKDEWVYHECLVHPPLLLHPSPKSVYIMGGGEGSTAREALRHKSVKKVVMCDIDEEVVKFCRSYLTCNAEAFRSSRLELVIDDAKANLESREDRFDVIIGDLADPLECGPCYLLYTRGFYQSIVKPKLNPNGILVTQAGPAGILTHKEVFTSIYNTLRQVFTYVVAYSAHVPSYADTWGWVMASDHPFTHISNVDEVDNKIKQRIQGELRYLDGSTLHASTILNKSVRESIAKEKHVYTEDSARFIYGHGRGVNAH